MNWLNYHHLLYFWSVARLGSIARACAELHVTQPTISGQLRALENSAGVKLFERAGRNLVLTPPGRQVFEYADRIFSLGQELQDKLRGRARGGPTRLVVGVASVLPRLVVYRLLRPIWQLAEPVRLTCFDDKTELLLARLALNELDVVLSDVPASPLVRVPAYSQLLGECGVSVLGPTKEAAARRRGFPKSLDGAPLWLPMEWTSLRQQLDQWFDQQRIRPQVLGELADSDLFDAFAQAGTGLFVVPSVVEKEARVQTGIGLVGRIETIRQRFYAICLERRASHPAVKAITKDAPARLQVK